MTEYSSISDVINFEVRSIIVSNPYFMLEVGRRTSIFTLKLRGGISRECGFHSQNSKSFVYTVDVKMGMSPRNFGRSDLSQIKEVFNYGLFSVPVILDHF